jgi:hypothetical protein
MVNEQELVSKAKRVGDAVSKRIGLDVYGTYNEFHSLFVFGVKGESGPTSRGGMLDGELGSTMSEEELTNYVIWAINKNTLRNRHGR